jgi:hypothetical protein
MKQLFLTFTSTSFNCFCVINEVFQKHIYRENWGSSLLMWSVPHRKLHEIPPTEWIVFCGLAVSRSGQFISPIGNIYKLLLPGKLNTLYISLDCHCLKNVRKFISTITMGGLQDLIFRCTTETLLCDRRPIILFRFVDTTTRGLVGLVGSCTIRLKV